MAEGATLPPEQRADKASMAAFGLPRTLETRRNLCEGMQPLTLDGTSALAYVDSHTETHERERERGLPIESLSHMTKSLVKEDCRMKSA
jgi:hypothetical protein